jgi:type IV pilus assembly protein PilY1
MKSQKGAPMRRLSHKLHGSVPRTLLAAVACAGAAVVSRPALAASDTNPPMPDVLLMIDSSGSMELMMDGCNQDTGLYADGTSCSTVTCDGSTVVSQNRWATQVAALTGSFGGNGYSCIAMPRNSGTNFVTEYSLQYASSSSTVAPYDEDYYLPYHRPVEKLTSTTACSIGWDQSASGWYPDSSTSHAEYPNAPGSEDFDNAHIGGYQVSTASTNLGGQIVANTNAARATSSSSTCTFSQNSDGLINQGLQSIRFGLMTFDNDTLPNTGVTVTASSDAVNTDGTGFDLTFANAANTSLTNNAVTGMWSYFNGWETASSSNNWTGASIGKPAGCSTCPTIDSTCPSLIPFEVGARHPAAPPWEGRLMRFPYQGLVNPSSNNSRVMQAITAMRPYGANPIAGMMDDAKYYYWTDPAGPQQSDPYFYGGCRPGYIILLSHAAPNLDLQTYCQGTSGGFQGYCPYDYPEYIAQGLAAGTYTNGSGVVNAKSATATGKAVKTYVVGFVEKQITTGKSCNDVLVTSGGTTTLNTSLCGNEETNGVDAGAGSDPTYASCCALARIAINGGTNTPYFADNATDLSTALSTILALINSSVSTRTPPVVLPQTANGASGGAVSETFISSFTATPGIPWSGNVQRETYACSLSGGSGSSWSTQTNAPVQSNGDDFLYNMEQAQSSANRNVLAIEPFPAASVSSLPTGLDHRRATGNIRPYINGTNSTTGTMAAYGFDNYSAYDGQEYGSSYTPGSMTNSTVPISTTAITPDALGYTSTSPCTFKENGARRPCPPPSRRTTPTASRRRSTTSSARRARRRTGTRRRSPSRRASGARRRRTRTTRWAASTTRRRSSPRRRARSCVTTRTRRS